MTYGWETSTTVGFNETRNGVSDSLYFIPDVYMVNQGYYNEDSFDVLYCFDENTAYSDSESEYVAWIGHRDYGPGKLRPLLSIPTSLLSEHQNGTWNIIGE